MSLIKIIIINTLIVFPIFAQGVMNGFSLGNLEQYQGTATSGDGVATLVPSFDKSISLVNPSTWHNFKFTHLSINYGADRNEWGTSSSHGYSGLKNAIWIIPLKSKGSVGLSIRPYSNQQFEAIESDSTEYFAFDDTLHYHRSLSRSGGIAAFKFGGSILMNETFSFGFDFDLLFGSSRQHESISFGGSPVIHTSRTRYSGVLSNFYLNGELSKSMNLYGSLSTTLSPLNALYTERYLFDDANKNGYHDVSFPYDFPSPDSVDVYDEVRYKDIHKPINYSLGTTISLSKQTSAAIEYMKSTDNGTIPNGLVMGIPDWIQESNQINFTWNRFANPLSLKFLDKFIIRGGLTYKSHTLAKDENSVTEYGLSIGSGFKFKAVGNQIDINYFIGKRDYSKSYQDETIQQLQVSVTLADLWFVKRRQK